MKRRNNIKEVAFKDYTVVKENLPFPIVLYPGFYGAFFGFRESENSPILFCSCAEEAIQNYLRFRLSSQIQANSDPTRCFILSSMYFPRAVVDRLMQQNKPNSKQIINHLSFENKLCHECNNVVPSYRYCVEMYGSSFKQNYGWYINKQAFEFGILPITSHVIPEICPQEILELIKLDPIETSKKYQELVNSDFEKADKLLKDFQKQKRRIWNIIENEVRQKFGHKKIGASWTSETILYHIICSLFPNFTIRRHYRPDFLEGLELDIFIEELKVGLEYQGIQHYEPVNHWGGKETLEKLQKRDLKKKKIADSLGIPIVYFKYDEHLNDEIVIGKVKKYINF
jgi:hypothetical protein